MFPCCEDCVFHRLSVTDFWTNAKLVSRLVLLAEEVPTLSHVDVISTMSDDDVAWKQCQRPRLWVDPVVIRIETIAVQSDLTHYEARQRPPWHSVPHHCTVLEIVGALHVVGCDYESQQYREPALFSKRGVGGV